MRHESSSNPVRGIEREQRFEPVAENVGAARDFVAGALADEDYHGDANTVLLLVSELASNAVRHAATPFEIKVAIGHGGVRVAVIDGDAEHQPEVRHPSPLDSNGRGLLIVDRLAAGWGSDAVGTRSKAVWFTLA